MYDWMKEQQKNEKIQHLAEYIIDNDATIRNAAENCLIPRTTLYKYMTQDLRYLNIELYDQVKVILNRHYKERVPRMNDAKWQRRGCRKPKKG